MSFTFDDGYRSVSTAARPILSARGMKGTAYVITGELGEAGRMSWKEVVALQNNHNWEIGSHSVTHPSLPSLSEEAIAGELKGSIAAMRSQGLRVSTFAAPYGSFDTRLLAESARVYSAFRPFDDAPLNVWPYQRLLVQVKTVQTGVTLSEVRLWLDEARRSKAWLVLVFHDIVETAAERGNWGYTQSGLAEIADEVKARGLPVVTVAQVIGPTSKAPVFAEDFMNGLGGFVTDAPAFVVADRGNRGSLPDPAGSVELSGGRGASAHLFSPRFAVSTSHSYVLESFVSTAEVDSALGVYIDEYDSKGVWLSGQYLADIVGGTVQIPALRYRPSSTGVRAASIQYILPSGARGRAFIDSVRLYQAN